MRTWEAIICVWLTQGQLRPTYGTYDQPVAVTTNQFWPMSAITIIENSNYDQHTNICLRQFLFIADLKLHFYNDKNTATLCKYLLCKTGIQYSLVFLKIDVCF